MSTQEHLNFVKHTNYKLFGKVIFTKEEIYTEVSTEGEPFKIIVNQDYFNKEFDLKPKQNNGEKSKQS